MTSIVRIDGNRTHGYQVRVGGYRYYSKMFSDGPCDGKEPALKKAKAHLEEYCRQHPQEDYRYFRYSVNGDHLQANNSSGFTGVYKSFAFDKRRVNPHRRDYWAAYYSIDRYGKRCRRHRPFYIDMLGEGQAKRLAIRFREMWEKAVRESITAAMVFLSEYSGGLKND